MSRGAGGTSGSSRRTRVWREVGRDRIPLLRAIYVDQRFDRHSQDSWVVGTNLRGRASCFGRSELEVGPGALAVVPPGVAHGGHRCGGAAWEYVAAYPTQELLLALQRDLTGRDAPALAFPGLVVEDAALARDFARAHAAAIAGDDPLAVESRLLDVLGRLLATHAGGRLRRQRPGAAPPPVERGREYIEDHLSRALTLEEIASAAGYTRFHFLRLFKARTGETPHAYVMRRRVERAREALRRGRSIAETAHACGFADQAHLTRRFRRMVGVTPGEFVRGAGAPARR